MFEVQVERSERFRVAPLHEKSTAVYLRRSAAFKSEVLGKLQQINDIQELLH